MESKIISEKENALFKRKEVQLEIEAEVTPSQTEAKKIISEKFSTSPEKVRIKKIDGKFGTRIFTISANIYSSEQELKKTESFSKKELEKMKQAEQKPEETKEEVPVKKVKEENKNEEGSKEGV